MIEMLDQDTLDARTDILLAAWGYTADDMESDDPDMQSSVHAARQRAYDAATAFPSEIGDDLFAEYVSEGIIR